MKIKGFGHNVSIIIFFIYKADFLEMNCNLFHSEIKKKCKIFFQSAFISAIRTLKKNQQKTQFLCFALFFWFEIF